MPLLAYPRLFLGDGNQKQGRDNMKGQDIDYNYFSSQYLS